MFTQDPGENYRKTSVINGFPVPLGRGTDVGQGWDGAGQTVGQTRDKSL